MTKTTLFLCICIYALATGCGENPYEGYDQVFNEKGVIILRNKPIADSADKSWADKTTDPEFGRIIENHELGARMIQIFQERIKEGDDTTTKYVDLYFDNLQRYIANIASNVSTTKDLGIRIYFAKSIDKDSLPLKTTTVLGPVKRSGEIIEALWRKEPNMFFAFDYGSLCPERCPEGDIFIQSTRTQSDTTRQ